MGVKTKDSKKPRGENLRAAIVAQVEELLTTHVGGVLDFLEQSEDKHEAVTFNCKIDCSESEPVVEVGIRYSQSVTDSRTARLDSPDQGTFSPVVEQAEEETKKRRGRNAKKLAGDGEPDEEANPAG